MNSKLLSLATSALLGLLLLGPGHPDTMFAQRTLPEKADTRFLTPIADPDSIPKFVNDLPVVQKLGIRWDATVNTNFTVRCTQVQQDILGDGHMTKLLGFAVGNLPATHPGATIVTMKDVPVHVTWINDFGFTYPVPIDTSIMWAFSMGQYKGRTIVNNGVPFVPHLHGAHTDAIYDGLPEQWWTPLYHSTSNPLTKGPEFVTNVYTYDNSQESGTLWYHDHTLGITRLNAYLGLAGFYFVRDNNELNLIQNHQIPSDTCEIELAIQDKVFWPDGQLAIPNVPSTNRGIATDIMQPEFFGNVICVNGKVWPKLNVSPLQYRFRIVNASDSRFYHIWLEAEDNPGQPISFKEIGTEDGLLQSPVTMDSLIIGCGERYDIVVNFAGLQGKRIIVKNDAGAPFGNANPEPVDGNTGVVMRFDVRNEVVVDPVQLTSNLRPAIAPLFQSGPTRELILAEMMDEYGRIMPMLGTASAGVKMFMEPPTENIKLNDVEVWKIYNTTADAHPIHLHLVSFQIISRQGFSADQDPMTGALTNIQLIGSPQAPPPELQGWKDTHVMYPGEVTTIRAKFDKPGAYVWHCHILSHEEHDMMRKYYVRHTLVAPLPAAPANLATGIARTTSFTWGSVLDADTYTIEVASNPSFTSPVVSQSGIAATQFTPLAPLNSATVYYWHVRPVNVDGPGPWSEVFSFTTDGNTGPAHFAYTGYTGSSMTIGIPNTADLFIDGLPIVSGDEIGVFNASGLCVGAVVWHGVNVALTVWGDNERVSGINGMLAGDSLYFRIWKQSPGIEYLGAAPVYENGSGLFADGATAVLQSLSALTTPPGRQAYIIPPGWSMVSTYIRPSNTSMDAVTQPFVSNLVVVKNGAGLVYWPSLGVRQLSDWNNTQGYQVFMLHGDTTDFNGVIERPETTPIPLIQGWNMVGYLRYSPQVPNVSFNSIAPNLVLAKNNYGQIYWPAFGINMISALAPGQGYQLYMSAADTLIYPGNDALLPSGIGLLQPAARYADNGPVNHFTPAFTRTGSSATLLLRFKEVVKDMDEVAVKTMNGVCIGSGIVDKQRAVVTLWGDNAMTQPVDGAAEAEALTLSYWSASEKIERLLTLENLADGVSGKSAGAELLYRTDAILTSDVLLGRTIATSVLASGSIPADFVLEQNYPNPFNPSTRILFGLPRNAHVTLEVYNLLGQRIARMIDEAMPAGYHEAAFDASGLASGIYIYRLAAGDFVQVKRMMLLR